mmetsp:Transcript_25147/g.86120  ORF Transcript_25147/g.86120 Transcript_25147/m.86120 type:complete len:251 (-) Transcript_25147:893-1645(-)
MARYMESATSWTLQGFTRSAPLRDALHPANSDTTRHEGPTGPDMGPVSIPPPGSCALRACCRMATYSLGCRFSPSRTAVSTHTSATAYSAARSCGGHGASVNSIAGPAGVEYLPLMRSTVCSRWARSALVSSLSLRAGFTACTNTTFPTRVSCVSSSSSNAASLKSSPLKSSRSSTPTRTVRPACWTASSWQRWRHPGERSRSPSRSGSTPVGRIFTHTRRPSTSSSMLPRLLWKSRPRMRLQQLRKCLA